jgi:uncharacterized membrane protein YkoI
MRTPAHIGFAAVAALLAAGLAVSASALAEEDYEEATHLKEAGVILPLDEIIARAQAIRPGRVIETELEAAEGGHRYVLEILDEQGVVWELIFDARTGKPLTGRGEHER